MTLARTIAQLKRQIEQIEKSLAKMKEQIEALSKAGPAKKRKARSPKKQAVPTVKQLRAVHESLYEEFLVGGPSRVEQFVQGKTKVYLEPFCKANDLPVSAGRASKAVIAREVAQWFAQRKVITKKATSSIGGRP